MVQNGRTSCESNDSILYRQIEDVFVMKFHIEIDITDMWGLYEETGEISPARKEIEKEDRAYMRKLEK